MKATSNERNWGSNVPVSIPEPPKQSFSDLTVDMGGLGFSPLGIIFNMSEADREEFYTAPYGPNSVPDGR